MDLKGSSRDATTSTLQVARYRVQISLLLLFTLVLTSTVASAGWFSDPPTMRVEIADPYIELHSGAGRGYPVFHFEDRGSWI